MIIQIVMDKSPEMQKLCPQKHIWFQRICVPMRILQLNPEIKYLFFFDADIGVINPKHRLEDYINPKYDLSFYERVFNYDIMTGSFIIKNTKFAIKFIQDWMELEKSFIREYGANDQAAIHQTLLNLYYPNDPRKEKCEKIWTSSDNKTLEGHTQFVGCARSIMDDRMELDKIIIYPKGSHKAWVRDIWLTQSEWAPRDFMLHDIEDFKISNDPIQLKRDPRYFPNPFISDAVFHSSLCTAEKGLDCWKYNSTLIKTDKIIDEKIEKKAKEVRKKYLEYIQTL
uniref:Nucleotide-diphospho-sugar transferase domain-containing protein n=1 Tax=Panagrolaimus davidi TaxID=227884 RepID=A0A914PFE1_9BILA